MIPVQLIFPFELKSLYGSIDFALKNECKWIQIRTKGKLRKKDEQTLREIKTLCRSHDAMLVIENDILLAKEIEADGVFMEKGDISEARSYLGEGYIIGTAANDAEKIVEFKKKSADYIAVGPYLQNVSKQSINGYSCIVNELDEKEVFIPLVLFGEIDVENLQTIVKSGVNGIAINISDHADNNTNIKALLDAAKSTGNV